MTNVIRNPSVSWLPMEYGTIATFRPKDRCLPHGLNNAVVLLIEWDGLHDLVHLVPQLGGSQVVGGG